MTQAVRHLALLLLAAVIASVIGAGVAQGSIFKKSDAFTVSNIETVNDDIYAWSNNINIDGVVLGDVSSFSFSHVVSGEISQSANIFANKLRHRGKIDGSLRAFAQTITIDGYVGRSALLFGQSVAVSSGAVIERDLTVFAADASIEGAVKGNLILKGGRVELAGVIAGDVTINADHISIVKPAVIIGNLTYTSEREADIALTDGVTITGQTIWKNPKDEQPADDETDASYRTLIYRVSSLLAAFLFGIIVVRLFRPYAEDSFTQLRTRLATSFAAGLFGIGALIVCVIVLLLALVLMLVGFVLLRTEVAPLGSLVLIFSILMVPISSFLSITGGIIFYSGKIVLGFLIGYLILRNIRTLSGPLSKSALFLGLVILTLLFSVPYVGFLFYLLASIIGAGAILLAIRNVKRLIIPGTGPATAAPYPEVPPPVTPPSAPSAPGAPGPGAEGFA